MASRPFPEIPCIVCSKPVNLGIDLCADENGKAVHEECLCPAGHEFAQRSCCNRGRLISTVRVGTRRTSTPLLAW